MPQGRSAYRRSYREMQMLEDILNSVIDDDYVPQNGLSTDDLEQLPSHTVGTEYEEVIDMTECPNESIVDLTNSDQDTSYQPLYRIVLEEKESALLNETCSVCLDTFQENDKYIKLPCKHTFHKRCVRRWLRQHNTCPLCRETI